MSPPLRGLFSHELALACISNANCFAKFGGYFEEKIVLRNMRNIVPNRAKFISFWAPEKNSCEMWLHRAKFSYGGSKFSYGGWSRATGRSGSTPQPPI